MKKNRRIIKIIIVVIAFLVLCSHSYLFRKYFVIWFAPEETLNFTYTTLKAECKIIEPVDWKSGPRTWEQIEGRFERFKHCYPTTTDTVLYRTMKKEVWQFWNWVGFFTHPRYKLPYIDPKTIPQWPDKRPPTLCPGEF